MSDELKVPKRRVQVEVLVPGAPPEKVTVFLAEFASTHTGPERLSDLLNAHDEFFPAQDASGETRFLGRHSIAAARVEREWELGEELPEGHQHEVEIQLAGGIQLRGLVSFVLPHDRSRLLDYLNDPQPFVRLAEQDKVSLVNKRHILRVSKAK